jgi:hypothetical protein
MLLTIRGIRVFFFIIQKLLLILSQKVQKIHIFDEENHLNSDIYIFVGEFLFSQKNIIIIFPLLSEKKNRRKCEFFSFFLFFSLMTKRSQVEEMKISAFYLEQKQRIKMISVLSRVGNDQHRRLFDYN